MSEGGRMSPNRTSKPRFPMSGRWGRDIDGEPCWHMTPPWCEGVDYEEGGLLEESAAIVIRRDRLEVRERPVDGWDSDRPADRRRLQDLIRALRLVYVQLYGREPLRHTGGGTRPVGIGRGGTP